MELRESEIELGIIQDDNPLLSSEDNEDCISPKQSENKNDHDTQIPMKVVSSASLGDEKVEERSSTSVEGVLEENNKETIERFSTSVEEALEENEKEPKERDDGSEVESSDNNG